MENPDECDHITPNNFQKVSHSDHGYVKSLDFLLFPIMISLTVEDFTLNYC